MVNMYSIINSLCCREGITIAQMCKNIGMRQSVITELKHGRTKKLSHANMLKIANYFYVSTDIFNDEVWEETTPSDADIERFFQEDSKTVREKEKAPILTKKDECDIAKDLEKMQQRLENGEGLMFDGDPLSDEAKDSILQAMKLGMQAAKLKNKEKYTPHKYKEK